MMAAVNVRLLANLRVKHHAELQIRNVKNRNDKGGLK
jgi:hypothetical protein